MMNLFGRVSVCGAISEYNTDAPKGSVLCNMTLCNYCCFRTLCEPVHPLPSTQGGGVYSAQVDKRVARVFQANE